MNNKGEVIEKVADYIGVESFAKVIENLYRECLEEFLIPWVHVALVKSDRSFRVIEIHTSLGVSFTIAAAVPQKQLYGMLQLERVRCIYPVEGVNIKAVASQKVRATGGHPSKRTYQAIRIELNHELDVLRDNLDDMIDLLNPGGRICIITFHSLEDRIVKSNFKKNENPCTCPPSFPVCVCGNKSKGTVITRKPILPSEKELEENSRSKSAKLRVFEKNDL